MLSEQAPGTMSPDDLQAIVQREIEDAVSYIENDVAPKRAESVRYYRGDKFGNEEEGRSQVVTRDVRDSVRAVLPSLMRVFFGSERPVEFVPTGPEDVGMAEQATDYVNYVFMQDNPGFAVARAAFKDSLYQKNGVIKYWWDESVEVTYQSFTGLSDFALGALAGEPGVEVSEVNSVEVQPGVMEHSCTVKHTNRKGRIRVDVVPPEEFLIDRKARDVETARFVGHRCYKTFSELVALGYDPAMLEDYVSASSGIWSSEEVYTRYRDRGGLYGDDTLNSGEREILYVESWIRLDLDGDGIGELQKVCTVGEGYEIVNIEPAQERPFAVFCPDPEPHVFFGSDVADHVKDIQLIRSAVLRNVLDSLGHSIHPRTAVVEGMVNMEDALNTETGAIIRQTAPGMVTPFVVPFVGREAFPVLEMLKTERDERVGVHNMALEADALQSTTKAAVNAQVDAARQHLEEIARIYAEVGFTKLFKGLLRLIVAHQDKPRTVRLRNQWVEIDPRAWNTSMDVTVNVGLGHGMAEDRLMVLREVVAIQKEALASLGPSNPLVGLGQVRNTLGKMLEQSGFKDTAQFFKPIPVDFEIPPQPPKPTPDELLAQIETQKTQAKSLSDAARLELDRDKLYAEIILRAREIEAQYQTQVDVAQIRRSIEENKLAAKNERAQ